MTKKRKAELIEYEVHMPRTAKDAMRAVAVDLDKLNKRLLTILSRDISQLMVKSKKSSLGKDESQSLVAYLKLVRSLKKEELDELEEMSAEELEKVVKG